MLIQWYLRGDNFSMVFPEVIYFYFKVLFCIRMLLLNLALTVEQNDAVLTLVCIGTHACTHKMYIYTHRYV